MLLFSYGANSIKKIKERINKDDDIFFTKAYIDNHVRIFSGKSNRWNNGAISSILYSNGNKVYGIALELNENELSKLNNFEKGYHLEEKDVIIKNKVVKCHVYIKDNNDYHTLPSSSYLLAINDMLNDRGIKENRKIMIRRLSNNKIITIGYWTELNGISLNINKFSNNIL